MYKTEILCKRISQGAGGFTVESSSVAFDPSPLHNIVSSTCTQNQDRLGEQCADQRLRKLATSANYEGRPTDITVHSLTWQVSEYSTSSRSIVRTTG